MLNKLFIYFNHYHDSKTLSFIYFVSLKMHRKPLVYVPQCQVPNRTPQNKSGSNRVTPPTKDTWLHAKTALTTIRGQTWILPHQACTTIFESPLATTRSIPTSKANSSARVAAIASILTTEKAWLTCCDRDTITKPSWSWITYMIHKILFILFYLIGREHVPTL